MHRLDFRVEGLTEERLRRSRQGPSGAVAVALGFLAAILVLRTGPGGRRGSSETTPGVVVTGSAVTASPSSTAVSPSTTPTPVIPTPIPTATPTATAPAPTVTETPIPSGVLAFEPAQTEFGVQPVKGTPAVRTLRVANGGTADFHIGAVSISGSAAEDYVARRNDCTGRALSPRENCTVEVSFVPRVAGARNAFLVVADDAPGNPHRLRLSGTGAVPSVVVQPAALDFGEQQVKTASPVRSITLRNSGSMGLKPDIRLQGDAVEQYLLSAEDCSRRTLEPRASCRVSLQFRPSREGRHAVTLGVADGTGTRLASASITGTTPKSVPMARVHPGALDFTSASTQGVAVQNAGTSTLTITAVSVEGPDRTAFRVDANACLQAPVAMQSACSIRVRYAPPILSFKASRTAELVIVDNAPDSPQRVPLGWSRPTPGPTPSGPSIVDVFLPKVPSVLGLSVQGARQRLEEHGLRLGRVRQEPSDNPPGIVFRQNPEAGQQATVSTRVDVWVSGTADEPISPRVPSVLGLSVERARQRLEEHGFRLGSVRQGRGDAPAGAIFRQNPEAERQVPPSTRVDVWVSVSGTSDGPMIYKPN